MMLGRAYVYLVAGVGLAFSEIRAGEEWEMLAPYFSPPEKYARDVGEYASPLVFNDGRRVEDPEEWPDRRKEILETWRVPR